MDVDPLASLAGIAVVFGAVGAVAAMLLGRRRLAAILGLTALLGLVVAGAWALAL